MKIDRRMFFTCLLGLAFVPLRAYAPFVYKRLTGPLESCGLSIPFACLPINVYIRGPRYRVHLDRISK